MLVFLGLLVVGLSFPSVMGNIAPNGSYGIRTSHAFASPEDWYRINRLGGLLMGAAGCGSCLLGLPGLLVPRGILVRYIVFAVAASVALYAICLWITEKL